MKALITGASSGIGREIARQLSAMGIDVILVARRMTRLQELKEELEGNVQIICMDLRDALSCRMLYERLREEDIDILVNNAGFGVYGAFDETDLDKELAMIDVNVRAVHILTKLFLRDFIARDYGYILNVASIAGYLPGPLMAGYYASKAYVLRLSEAIYGELRRKKSNVHITALCPGPVQTEFFDRAEAVKKSPPYKKAFRASKEKVVAKALNDAKKKRSMSVYGGAINLMRLGAKLIPHEWLLKGYR